MENTLENKKKFFALYYDVPCIQNDEWIWRENDEFGKLPYGSDITDCYAILKPLSSITDEDSISLAELILKSKLKGAYVFNDGNNRRIHHEGTYTTIYHDLYCRPCSGDPVREMPFTAIDYLRSKGYALPWMGLSVEQLEEYGWIKLKK